MSATNGNTYDKLVWWILGVAVTLTGTLALIALNSVRDTLKDMAINQRNMQGRIALVETLVTSVNTMSAEQREMEAKVALIESIAASINAVGIEQHAMDRRLVALEQIVAER